MTATYNRLVTSSDIGPTISQSLKSVTKNVNYQINLTGSGTVSAVVALEVSNDNISWISDGDTVFYLSGNNSTSVGYISKAPWYYVRLNILAISGVSASITANYSS